jgi:hypothetical protein
MPLRSVSCSVVARAAFLLISISSPANLIAQTFTHNEDGRTTCLWMPTDAEIIRGILIIGNGAGGDSTGAAFNPIYQRFGQLHSFAVIGTGFWTNFSSSTELTIWDNHLAALATASGHPELVHAPYAPIGLSNGGQMSYGFNALRPEKVIAFITNKGCCYNDRLPSDAALHTPGLLIAGELDTAVRRDSIRGLFVDNRPRGALWSWVEEENTGHAATAGDVHRAAFDRPTGYLSGSSNIRRGGTGRIPRVNASIRAERLVVSGDRRAREARASHPPPGNDRRPRARRGPRGVVGNEVLGRAKFLCV